MQEDRWDSVTADSWYRRIIAGGLWLAAPLLAGGAIVYWGVKRSRSKEQGSEEATPQGPEQERDASRRADEERETSQRAGEDRPSQSGTTSASATTSSLEADISVGEAASRTFSSAKASPPAGPSSAEPSSTRTSSSARTSSVAERSSSGRTSSAARPLLDDTPVAEPPPLLESSGSGTDAGADASVAWLAWPATPLAEAAATLSPAVLPVTVIDSLEGLALEASPVKDDRAEVVRVQCHLGARADSAEVTITDFGPWGLRYDLGGRADRGASVSLGAPAGIPGEPVGCTVAWCRKKPRRDEYRVSLLYSATVEELSRTWMGQLASALCPTLEQLGSRFQEFEVPVRQGGVSGRLLDLGLSGARVRLDSPRPAGRGELVLGPWQDLTEVVIPGQLTEHGQFRFVPEAGPSVPALGSYLLRLIRSIG